VDVLVINLARSPDRRAFMAEKLELLGIAHEFFPGIDGSLGMHDAFTQYDRDTCIRRFGAPLAPGEVGCFASHYRAWEECVRRGKPLTVMEDDVELSSGFPEVLGLAGARVLEHKLIRLAGLFRRPFRVVETIDETHRLVRYLRGPAGMQCYVLSPEGAAALLRYAQSWVEPVDLYIDRFWYHGVQSNAITPFETRHSHALGESLTRDRSLPGRSVLHKFSREFHRLVDDISRNTYNIIHRP
jgi:glycosyl transferase, family 25